MDWKAYCDDTCNQVIITHQEEGYVSCEEGDIGKPVAGSESGANGILIAYDNTNRLWRVSVSVGEFASGDTDTITGGTGSGVSTSVDDSLKNLTMLVAGYVNCVAGDIGLTVTGSVSGHTGILVAYDNTKKIWTVSTLQTFQPTDICTIGDGTGVGTVVTYTEFEADDLEDAIPLAKSWYDTLSVDIIYFYEETHSDYIFAIDGSVE